MIEKMNSMLGNPNVKTFLDFLAKAEGGDYNVVVGGGTFDDFSKHPGRVGLRTKEGPSTAAGRYQITKTTFDDVAPKLGLKDFSPRSQDLAAVYLLQRRGALEDVAGGNWDEAINKLGKEWASLPTSKYQQPKKTWDYVRENLSEKTVVAGASADAVGSKEDVSTPIVPTAEPESVFAAVSTPATAPETRTMDQPGVAKVEELPETYRLALAANYLADTEDESVTERAVQMIEEREEAARGGAGKIPALAAFGGGNQQAVDPFQFVLQREEQQAEPRRRPVPKMPVKFAEGGEVSPEELMEQMSVGALPEQTAPSSVDTAVNDYLRMQSKLVTDPKTWFQTADRRLSETIEQDPTEFALGFTGAGIAGILKPKGGTFLSGPASELEAGINAFKQSLKDRIERRANTPVAEKAKASIDFFDKQFKSYHQRKLGSQEDSLRDAFIRGDFKGKERLSAENVNYLDTQRAIAQQGQNPEARAQALKELNRWYDDFAGIQAVVPESMPFPLSQSLERRQAQLRQQGVSVPQSDLYKATAEVPERVLDPRTRKAFTEKDVAYDARSALDIEQRMQYLDDYLVTLSPQQIKNLRFEDAMIRSEQYHDFLTRAAKRDVTPEELFAGRKKVLEVGDKEWRDIVDPKALELEGLFMDHCIGGAGYCEDLTSGVGKHFSLQNKKTGEPHTTLSIYKSPFSSGNKHVIIQQIKGKSNSAPEKYFPEIEKFLENYESQVGRIYITEKRTHIPPAFRTPEYTDIPKAFRGNE